MNDRSEPIIAVTDPTAADLCGNCDICDSPYVVAIAYGTYVCADERCAAEALRDAVGIYES